MKRLQSVPLEFAYWLGKCQNNLANRSTRRALLKLTEHQLRDIGLTRGQINDIDFVRALSDGNQPSVRGVGAFASCRLKGTAS
jgi:uncharacterized protein YjiS (DUF1127 family)